MMNNVIDAIVADPRLIGAAFPLVTGLAVAALLRAGFGRRMGGVAALGALIAFLLVYALIEGLPPIFAVTAKQKLFWLAVLGGIAGCLAGMGRRGGAPRRWAGP